MPVHLLLWQPVVSGRQHLQQFLRLRQVSQVVQGSSSGGSTQALLQQLELGHCVEVAGYTLAPQLAKGLSMASLDSVGGALKVVCIEVVTPEQQVNYTASPALAQQLQRWSAAGTPAQALGVAGEPFWQVPDAKLPLELIQATVAAVAHG
jgi:hypothetical protein